MEGDSNISPDYNMMEIDRFNNQIKGSESYGGSEFFQKADRFAAALEHYPNSRLFELLPVLFLLPIKRERFLDLFSGTGYVSQFLTPLFCSNFQIDEVSFLGTQNTTKFNIIIGNALEENALAGVKEKVDLAICLAGFHHVISYADTGAVDVEKTKAIRINALMQWKNILAEGGKLIIVDVPSLRANELPSPFPTHDSVVFDQLPETKGDTIKNFFDTIGLEQASPFNPFQIKSSYFSDINALPIRPRYSDLDPVGFFEDFVSKHSAVGHHACFQTERELHTHFVEAGFLRVNSFTTATPWLFPDKSAAVWFVHELFAIDSVASDPTEMSPNAVTLINAAIEKHLGCAVLPDGSCVIGWKLMYVWGEN